MSIWVKFVILDVQHLIQIDKIRLYSTYAYIHYNQAEHITPLSADRCAKIKVKPIKFVLMCDSCDQIKINLFK